MRARSRSLAPPFSSHTPPPSSGMIAFSLIPACCALFASDALELKRRPLARDIAAYLLSLGLLVFAFHDGVIQVYEGAALVLLYIAFIIIVAVSPRVGARSGCPGLRLALTHACPLVRARVDVPARPRRPLPDSAPLPHARAGQAGQEEEVVRVAEEGGGGDSETAAC